MSQLFLSAAKYHTKLWLKRQGAKLVNGFQKTQTFNSYPAVTLFISNLNTRYPLELTLRSLIKYTSYPDYRVIVADNASTDGSQLYLEHLEKEFEVPLSLIKSQQCKDHAEWLDQISRLVKTPYWLAVDSDMLFMGSDWLQDILATMLKNPRLYFLGAERRTPVTNYIEPTGGKAVNLGESASTWLFCVKTDLREQVQTSFQNTFNDFKALPLDPLYYDVTGKLLESLREHNLEYAFMPKSFQLKYHHFGSLSWFGKYNEDFDHYQLFKQYQLVDIKRRCIEGAY